MTQLVTIHGVRGFVGSDGMAQLNLEDVARGLGFTQRKNGVNYIRWRRVNGYLTEMGFSPLVGKECIPENAFYRLAMKADNETGRSFQAKVADEILPSIRRTGMYATAELLDNPDLLIEAATRLKKEREERLKLQAKIEQDKPKVVFAEALEVSKDSILVADLAKLLKQNGIEIGEIRLFDWMRQNGYLIKSGSERNMPTQRSMELKIMEIKIGQRMSASEGSKITRTPKITVKGQSYFINKFKEGA
ncbi:phage antirepressor KilAC domain-containing protein [Paenibacillus polymyxa]|uniref:phage antirepressor KilAC domain-containing protein n=1 Tax=Paenibacillus polymyxa TaxID=1406 RepID=UPI00129AA8CB|nr:phage antirepressor KilAC domain-containing protein [Paenibacillus polymyxa]KAE8559888.1 antirepressor [Paenibacillus polymyxa]MCJ1221269.1 phage antirepressor KilAC domain-containing protein [Paenibacillus polymyxa]